MHIFLLAVLLIVHHLYNFNLNFSRLVSSLHLLLFWFSIFFTSATGDLDLLSLSMKLRQEEIADEEEVDSSLSFSVFPSSPKKEKPFQDP
ncbi:hypothetical protein L6452_17617 [Arctium lappa]|uniref:Uncharacterized protein n=1 Tax=Arctium lappa TaxID=4217 RepID=A0ACB9C3S0_ARCLA|nr:hypothetical protein L6452_17617 [Arctium lappa]